MKTKLFTKNTYLGLLVAFVLALGVQGTADAISRLTRSSGDLQTVTAGHTYQIQFSVTLQSPTRTSTHTNYAQTPAGNVDATAVADKRNKTTYYLDDYDPDNDATARGYQSEAQVTYDTAHDYEQESIAIALTGGGAIQKVGSSDVPIDEQTAGFSMYESTHNDYSTTSDPHQRLSTSVTLTLTAPTPAAPVTITITPTTDGPTSVNPLTFTVYVVGALNPTGTTAVLASTNGVQRVSDQQDLRISEHFTFNPAANQPVYYTVEGSGRLYVSPAPDGSPSPVSDRKTSPTNNLYTSSSAPVFLDTNGGSSKVTAYIAGSGVAAKVLYIFSGGRINEQPQIEVRSGDGQTGAPRGQLDDYFEVRVTDGRRRPVSGLPVTFSSSPSGAMFIPVPGTRVYTNDESTDPPTDDPPDAASIDAKSPTTIEATATRPKVAPTHDVQTDRNGMAKIYYQLSSTSGVHTVTATAHGIGINAILSATASTTARAGVATLEIVSGNNQRADKGTFLKDDLVVIVRSLAGHRIQDRIIQFRTTTGILVPDSETDQPDLTELGFTETAANAARNPARGQQIYVKTGANGEAGVTYNVGQLTEAREVVAEVRHEAGDTQYDFAIDRVVFNINGGSSGGGDGRDDTRNEEPTTPNRLSISLSGSGDTRTVQVSALQAGTTSTSGIFTTLTTNGGTLSPTSGATPLTSTWTLPSGAGTYTVTATTAAGYTSASESVTVTVPGTLTARQDGGTIVVSASPAPTSNLAFRLTTSGGGYAGQGEILPTGSGRAIPILTTGTHVLTVNAEGYNATQVSFTPGTQTTTDTTTTTTTTTTQTGAAGVADSIEIDGARTLEGTVNQATRLRVRVLDATNRGVSGIRVTFRVLAPGRGRLSQRGNGRAVIAETDRSGTASASVTPLGGNLIVEAKAAGVSATVSFIIDVDGSTTPRETSDTTDGRTYQVGDKVPISLEDTLTFRGSRTLNGTAYTCVGSGECVVSYGTLVKGEITAAAVPKVQAKTYKTGEKIPISLTATLTFSGKHTLGGTVYTCVSDGECVVSYGILTKGEIEVSTVSTPSASDSPGMSDAKAVVGAANRPVMYWIEGGALYRLAGASAEQIAERATDVAVGSDKLYWIEQTSETRGAIHHANLDGSDAAVVKTLTSVPKGVALANGKLYITNGWGKIQRMNVDGTQFETNFLTNLGAPLGIAVSGSRVYWTDGSGRVRSAPLQGTKAIQNIVTGSGTLGGIVADGSKVYWTEQTGERSGRIRAANLDGTGITDAYTVTATVHGLALDPGNQQLYWTNGWGKVQRGVRGSRYQDVVTGLMTPTALAIGGANTATPMTATKPVQPAAEPNYDVDGSGTVDNADLFLVSLAVGTDNAQYDVNGDGTVNDKDIALVRDNRDNGAAAAPMVVGVKLTAEQVGRLQAQIDLLIVSGDRSPAALKTLVYLQQLIATARPERTQLLANYPNPFNPETWIPYELATDTDVRITIYAANGVVVRTLQLGQQSAGYYTDRERAAYWDGRNAHGETVASGVYFYQLETDEISSLRKMVILK